MAVAEEAFDGTNRHHPLAALAGEIDADGQRWGLPPSVSVALMAAPVALALVTAASLAHRPLFRALTREDGVFEWVQLALFVTGCGATALVGHRLRRQGLAPWSLLFGLCAFGLFVVAGEEISWGQRLLGYDTPHELAEINSQGESTIHNVGAAQEVFKAAEFAVALFGTVTPLILRTRFRPRRGALVRFAALTVPPLPLVPAFAVMAGYRFARYSVLPKTWVAVEATEAAELCLALGIAAVAVLMARRLGHEIPGEDGSWRAPAR